MNNPTRIGNSQQRIKAFQHLLCHSNQKRSHSNIKQTNANKQETLQTLLGDRIVTQKLNFQA